MEIPKELVESWKRDITDFLPNDDITSKQIRIFILLNCKLAFLQGIGYIQSGIIDYYEDNLDEDDDIDEDGYGRDGLPVTKPPKGLYKVSDEDLEKLEKLWNKDLDL